MKSDLYKGIAVCFGAIAVILLIAGLMIKADERDQKRMKKECEAMFVLANDLADSIKVAHINNFCLRYIR